MQVVKSHGCVCLKGPAIDQVAEQALAHLHGHGRPIASSAAPDTPLQVQQRQGRAHITGCDHEAHQTESAASSSSSGGNSLKCAEVAADADYSHSEDHDAQQESERLTPGTSQSSPGAFHVTLVTKEELASCQVGRQDLLQEFQQLNTASCFPAGMSSPSLGSATSQALTLATGRPHRPTQQPDMPEQQPQQHSRAAWVACVWNEANALRLQHGLSLKDFHISLQAPRNQPEPHSLACLMDDSPWPTDEGHLVMVRTVDPLMTSPFCCGKGPNEPCVLRHASGLGPVILQQTSSLRPSLS